MTKLNKKKLNKSTIAIIFLALALVLAISFGATFALFTATSKDITANNISTGHIKLTTSASFETVATNVLPGQSLLTANVTVTPDTADSASGGQYVAMKITISGTKGVATANAKGTGADLTGAELANALQVTIAEGWYQQSAIGGTAADDDYGFIYVYASNSSTLTPMSAAQTPLTSATGIILKATAEDEYNETTNSYDSGLMDAELTIHIQFKSVQVTSNTSATVASVAGLFAEPTP